MPIRGENIYKRKDGRWEARYVKGYELSGKKRYGSCYGRTYTEAKEKLAQVKAALLGGSYIPARGGRHRLLYYCDQWLASQKDRVKPSTYSRYETALERHIKPRLGGCFPLSLSTQLVDTFRQSMLCEDKLSPQTVKGILVILKSILQYTAKQFPSGFPAIEVHYPKDPKKEMRVLTQEEQRRFMDYLREDMDECKFGVLLALLTGLRIGELCALHWGDISLQAGTLRVSATMQRLPNSEGGQGGRTQICVGSPKSDTSARTIPLSPSAIRLCRTAGARPPATYVLTGNTCWMEPRALQYRMKKYTKECGLEGVHFHTLRHTFATRCVEAGFELKSLSEILGHASVSITMDRYVHSSMELKRANMDKLTEVGL